MPEETDRQAEDRPIIVAAARLVAAAERLRPMIDRAARAADPFYRARAEERDALDARRRALRSRNRR